MDDARKLLKAMREPGLDMAEAGAEIVSGYDPANHAEVATDVWRAMIEEAMVGDFAEHPAAPGKQDVPQPGLAREEEEDWPL